MQRVKAEAKTAGGIFLPETAVKELNEAKVLAVGPGGLDKDGKRVPMGCAAGDRVLIPQVSVAKTKKGCGMGANGTNSMAVLLSRLGMRSITFSGIARFWQRLMSRIMLKAPRGGNRRGD